MAQLLLRICGSDDYPELADVMYDAVRNGPSEYSAQQREAWVGGRRSGEEWERRLDGQTIFAAYDTTQIIGFISLATAGYIDFAYVRPTHQKRGVFGRLYRELENAARDTQLDRLWVHASLMARPAFASVGFEIEEEQAVEIAGERLKRFQMSKSLNP